MPQPISERQLTDLIGRLELTSPSAETTSPSAPPQKEWKEGDGIVTVLDNRFYITNPQPGGQPARLSPIPPVLLRVNGQPVHQPTEVRCSDHITWSVAEPPPFEIQITPDRLRAFLQLKAAERCSWKLADLPPAHQITVQAVPDDDVPGPPLTLEEIVSAAEKLSITAALHIPAIHQELLHPTFLPVCIAEGLPAKEGSDARIELYFSETIENKWTEVGGLIDYRNHLKIPSVRKGETIARKIPLREGEPGMDIFGHVLLPPEAKDIEIIAKDGVLLLPGGDIVALREGRPRMTGGQSKLFDIATAYEVQGNVSMRTGNIVFSGDVIVQGDVEDNMIIESLGNVYVAGNVYHSTITATGSIAVKGNVINSQLYSGYFGVLYNRLFHTSKLLIGEMGRLRQAANILADAVEAQHKMVKHGQVMLLLTETKFKNIPFLIRELLGVLSSIRQAYQQDTGQVQRLLEMALYPTKQIDYWNDGRLGTLIDLLEELHAGVARMQEAEVRVDISQCHGTIIKSNGDIVVRQEGILHSRLYSSGDITFLHDPAVCRGSALDAEGTITAGTVGGESGAPSFLKAGTRVVFRKMYAGSVTVGGCTRSIAEPVEHGDYTPASIRL